MTEDISSDTSCTEEGKESTIQVKDVNKNFGQFKAVQDLSFNIKKGEIVGFLGPNGAGKTTTMRLLTSYYTPDTGKILINGVDNAEHDLETRKSIGYLPENNPLYEDLLVSEYLSFIADLRGMKGPIRKNNLEQTIEEAGLSESEFVSSKNSDKVLSVKELEDRLQVAVDNEKYEVAAKIRDQINELKE